MAWNGNIVQPQWNFWFQATEDILPERKYAPGMLRKSLVVFNLPFKRAPQRLCLQKEHLHISLINFSSQKTNACSIFKSGCPKTRPSWKNAWIICKNVHLFTSNTHGFLRTFVLRRPFLRDNSSTLFF